MPSTWPGCARRNRVRSPTLVIRQVDRLIHEMGLSTVPVPVEDCVAHVNLTISGIPLGQLPPGDYRAILDQQKFDDAIQKVSGMLDRRHNEIYLKAGMTAGRQHFVTLHEVGHGFLPWQRSYPSHPDGDANLEDARLQFEWEANVFATETLFLRDRFQREAAAFPLNLQSALHLSTRYGASVHAGLRRFVEGHHQRCCLLVVDRLPTVRPRQSAHRVRAIFLSTPFRRRYPRWKRPTSLPVPLVQPLLKRRGPLDLPTELVIEGDGEVMPIILQGLDNGFDLLLLGRPVDGQPLPPRTTTRTIRR